MSGKLRVLSYPHPVLRHPCRPLRRVDAELRKLIAEMFELMYEHHGVGLAANQVGLPYRVFVMNPTADPAQREHERVIINPVLSRPKGSLEQEEGCLSLPGIYQPVFRPARIRLHAYDLQGREICAELSDMASRVVQHETDHLDGVLFIDRLSETRQREIRDLLRGLELEYETRRRGGEFDDQEIAQQVAELEKQRT